MNTRQQTLTRLVAASFFVLAATFPSVTPRRAMAVYRSSDFHALPGWWSAGEQTIDIKVRPHLAGITNVQIESPIGSEVVTQTLPAGQPVTYYAVGYSDAVTSTQVVTWSLSPTLGSLSAYLSPSTTLIPTVTGNAVLSATLFTTSTISATARITVTPGVAARLILSPTSATFRAGEVVTLEALAYDQYDNLGGNVTTSTTFALPSEARGTCTGNVCNAEGVGTWTVTGTHVNSSEQDVTGTAALTVLPAELDRLGVAGFPNSTVAGASFQSSVVVTAFDRFDNVKTDYVGTAHFSSSDESATVPSDYAFDGGDAGSHAFSGNGFFLYQAPSQTIMVEDVATSISQSAAPITVAPAELFRIIINSVAGNAGEARGFPVQVLAHTMDIYETYTAWAGCYDAYDNYCGDVQANWGATGVLSHGLFAPNPAISTTFTPAAVLSGTGTITAVHVSADETDSTGLFTIQAPSLIISKSGNPNPVAAGGYLFYTLVYANVGNAVARGVRITETFDPNVSPISSGPPPSVPPNVWTRPTLGVGQSSEIYVTVLVDGSMVPGSSVTNAVIIGGSRLEQHGFVETTVVTSTPDLTLTLDSLPDPVEPEGDLVYQIHYGNQGNAPVHDARIVLDYDDHLTFLTADPAPDAGTDNEWRIGDLQAGDDGAILVTGQVYEFMLGTHTLVTSGTIESDETAPFVVYETTAVSLTPSFLQLSVSNGRPAVEAGEVLVYALSYSNVGSGPAYSTTIVATPPSAELVHTTGCLPVETCEWNGEQSVYDVGTVPGGDGGTVYLVGRVIETLSAGTYVITASASITTVTPGDPPVGKYAQDVDAIDTHPDLQITADYHNLSPYPGKRVTYTIRYSNTERIATEGVVVTATQARHTVYDPVASSDWLTSADGHFTYTVGTMDYNQHGELLFVLTIPTEAFTAKMPPFFDTVFGIHDNGISGNDPDPSNNIAPAPLGLPDLIVTGIEVNWETLLSYEPGNHVTVTVKNQGTGIACDTERYATAQNPDACGLFYIDLYINPKVPPESYPAPQPVGIAFTDRAGPVYPGESNSYPIDKMLGDSSPLILPTTTVTPLFVSARVDSWESDRPSYGSVFEYDETNNIRGLLGPEYLKFVFLPIAVKRY